MNKMIDDKNKLLKEAGEKLSEVWEIGMMLDSVEMSSRDFETLLKLVAFRLRHIGCGHDEFFDEAEIALPEAEEGELDDDLPFVTPDERR